MGKEFPRNTRDDAFNPLWNHYDAPTTNGLASRCCSRTATGRTSAWRSAQPELIDDPRFAESKSRGKNIRRAGRDPRRSVRRASRATNGCEILKARRRLHLHASSTRSTTCPTIRRSGPTTTSSTTSIPRSARPTLVGMPVRLSETPGKPRGHAPELGEHTELLLTELLGYSWDDVARLREANVI